MSPVLLYRACVILHVLAMSLWIGHMLVWSLIAGPALKGVEPLETADLLRERSLYLGGLGWPALTVLVLTGLYLLNWRGLSVAGAIMGEGGWPVTLKLICVLGMILYQGIVGHRRSTVLLYANMALALVVLACSVLIARGLA
jgi:uncharacterized membrane protein